MRSYNLDILRIIFALLVVIMHINIDSIFKQVSIVNNAYVFVDFFFVLSAFVLYLSYERQYKSDTASILILKRIKRLYPLHLFILIIFFVFEIFKYYTVEKLLNYNTNAFNEETSLVSFLASLFLLDSFRIFSHNIWNAPAWSISAELYSYIFLVLLSTIKNYIRNIVFILAFCLIVVFVVNRGSLNYGFDFGILRCLYSYMIVILFFRLKLKSFINSFTFVLAILAVLAYFIFPEVFYQYEYILPLIFTIIVFHIYYKFPKFRFNKILLKLADLSFEVYLIQALVIVLFSDIFILLKNKCSFLYQIESNGLVIFFNSNYAIISTIIEMIIVVISATLISKVVLKYNFIKKLWM